MIIQFWHSRAYDYINELYIPVKEKLAHKHKIIFPHDEWPWIDTKKLLKKSNIFFAEVSYPATGLWIELWFAKNYWTKIICFYKEWSKISRSLKYICDDFFEYKNTEDMLNKIEEKLIHTNS